MKRDMELVRKILLKIEAEDKIGSAAEYGVSQAAFIGHVIILDEVGFIDGIRVEQAMDPSQLPTFFIVNWLRLTAAGHEFLSAARDPATWQTAKKEIEATGRQLGDVTIGVLQGILVRIFSASMGL